MPLLLPQAMWVKRTALRLPDAQQPWQGLVAAPDGARERPLRLLLVGESTVAGVGVECQQQALVGQLASQLAEQLGRPVRCAGAAACTHIARTAVESPIIKNNNQIQTRIKSTRLTQVPGQTSYGLPEPTTLIIFGDIFCDKYIS